MVFVFSFALVDTAMYTGTLSRVKIDGSGAVLTPVTDAELSSDGGRYTKPQAAGLGDFNLYLKSLSVIPPLSAESQNELVEAYQYCVSKLSDLEDVPSRGVAGRRARKTREVLDAQREHLLFLLLGANYRIILTIASEQAQARYGSSSRANTHVPDLVSDASVELIKAAGTYPVGSPVPFSKYLTKAVRDSIRASLSASSTSVKIPPSWRRTYRIASAARESFRLEYGKEPSLDELRELVLVKCLEWAEDKLTPEEAALPEPERQEAKIIKARKQGMLGAINQLGEVMQLGQSSSSLNAVVGSADSSTTELGDLLPSDISAESGSLEKMELRETLEIALAELSERDRLVVRLRYGFVDGKFWKYAEIAEHPDVGVTAERIRQIDQMVLRKLRSPHGQWALLNDYLPSQISDI